jgi:hypothetical protein
MTTVHAKNQIFILNSAELVFKNSSANVGIKLYDKLPNTIKRLDKIQEFKRRLKFILLQHIFYSVDEYMSSWVPLLLNCLLLCTLYSYYFVIPSNRILKKVYINP